MSAVFDPEALQTIVKKNLALPLEARIDAIIADIDEAYPRRITTRKRWNFTIAGSVMGQVNVLYGSITEYLLIVGFPVGTGGYSGRFASEIWDVMIEGEHQTFTLGQYEPTVYLAGDMAYLRKGIDKGCLMKPGVWMLEYARGFVPQMMPFGILANSLITMDFRSVRHQFWDFGRICVRELLRGKL